jgi:transposase-like protein
LGLSLSRRHRADDSAGETIEFMLSPKRDLTAAKRFLRLALSGVAPSPRVINVDGHPAYPSAIAELKQSGDRAGVRRMAVHIDDPWPDRRVCHKAS